jgi:hypothetical protein
LISLNRGPAFFPNQNSIAKYDAVRFGKSNIWGVISGLKKNKKVEPEKGKSEEYLNGKSNKKLPKSLFDTKLGFMSKIVKRVKNLENSLSESGISIKIGDRVDSNLVTRTCSDKRSLLKNTFLAVSVLPVFLLSRFYRWLAPNPNLAKAVRDKAADDFLPFALEKKTYLTKKMANKAAIRHFDTAKTGVKIAKLELQHSQGVFKVPFNTGHKSLLFVYTNNIQDAEQLVEAAEKNNQ